MSGLFSLGPCPTCGKAFESRDRKTFCSMICYHRSARFKAIVQERAASQRVPEQRACICCQAEFVVKPSSKRRYCSKICQRRWFAERHDRWVANPQKIALPQAYDEFMVQDELRCIVEGCDWTGHSLSMHVNVVHGIPAAEFKALAGFNKGTGLVSPGLAEALAARPYPHLRGNKEATADKMAEMRVASVAKAGQRSAPRLEHREHARKNFAERRAGPAPEIAYTCARCSTLFVKAGMRCSVKYCEPCRPLAHTERHMANNNPLVCSECQAGFLGNQRQRQRAQKGRVIFCAPCLAKDRIRKLALGRLMMKPKVKNMPERGPCPTCGQMFRHYAPQTHCSRACLQSSPGYKELMLKNLAARTDK